MANFYAIGQNVIAVNRQILEKESSHLVTLRRAQICSDFSVHDVSFARRRTERRSPSDVVVKAQRQEQRRRLERERRQDGHGADDRRLSPELAAATDRLEAAKTHFRTRFDDRKRDNDGVVFEANVETRNPLVADIKLVNFCTFRAGDHFRIFGIFLRLGTDCEWSVTMCLFGVVKLETAHILQVVVRRNFEEC